MPLSLRTPARLAIALAVLAPAPRLQTVWTVDDDGPADFAEVQAAVDAAADGDVLRVLPGAYAPVEVVAKGLTVLNSHAVTYIDQSGAPTAVAPFAVRGLAPDQTFVLDQGQVFFFHESETGSAALAVEDCAGAVLVQDVFIDSYGAPALRIEDSDAVVLVATVAQTNAVPALADGTGVGAPGAHVARSRVFAYDCSASGSHGSLTGFGHPTPLTPAPGGDGLVVVDAEVHLSGCSIGGGSGGTLMVRGCLTSAPGGDGLVVDGAGSSVRHRGGSIDGGFPGFSEACAPTPPPSQDIVVLAGQVDALPGAPRSLDAPGQVDGGSVFSLQLEGNPGDLVVLLLSTATAPSTRIAGVDVHLDTASMVILPAFVLPAATLSLPVPAPSVAGAVLPAAIQAVMLDGGTKVETAPQAVSFLPPAP